MAFNNNNILDQLFGTKAKILKLFLQHPQLILSTSDIVKRTNIRNREIEKFIISFVKMGILKKINGNGHKKIKKGK